ncbi:MAG: biopolymer transporter ExbD [Bacteroidota bacterium]
MNLRSRNKVDPAFSMSSMTDLVFLLLIFFIILSTMVTPNSLPVELPSASDNKTGSKSLSVSLFANGTLTVGSQIVKENELENELRKALSVKKEKSIMLNADKNSSTGDLVYILDIAKRNKWKIAMATKTK